MFNKMIATVAAAGFVLAPMAASAVATGTDRFEFVDTDRNGYISFVELQSNFEDDNNDISNVDFDRFDTDNNGGLDVAEYEVAVTSLGTGTSMFR